MRSTAELTWALIFAVLRQVPREHAAMRAGEWQTTVGTSLCIGRTLSSYCRITLSTERPRSRNNFV